MGAQRSSASKRQRDIDKRSRAAEKRDRRQRKSTLPEDEASAGAPGAVATDGRAGDDSSAILEQIEQLQHEFDADVIDFETYETRKADLLSRIQV